MKNENWKKKNEENKFLEVERCCEGISQRLARQDHYLLLVGHRPETQFLQNIFVEKKCFNFGCPSLGYNSEFWFYHQKCHFLCPHLGIFQTTKGSIGEPKLKFCGYIARKCLHNVKVGFGPKMSSCSLTAVKLLPSCQKAKLLPKYDDIVSCRIMQVLSHPNEIKLIDQ